jgi:hypothetical protein
MRFYNLIQFLAFSIINIYLPQARNTFNLKTMRNGPSFIRLLSSDVMHLLASLFTHDDGQLDGTMYCVC